MKKQLLLLSISSCLAASEMKDYFHLLEQSPFLGIAGEYKKGEIEIVLDRDRIGSIEKSQIERLVKKGIPLKQAEESARVGIIAEDTYWIWLRDAVLFPTGASGTYDRLVWKSSLSHQGVPGIAVLPVLPDGRFALNLNYRHATRSWELELPRGIIKEGESEADAAKREVQEETGLISKELIHLGVITPDSGVLSSTVPIFYSRIEKEGKSDQEESEAILGFRAFTLAELKKGLQAGGIELEIHGAKKWVPLRDCFLTYALFQAMTQGLIEPVPK